MLNHNSNEWTNLSKLYTQLQSKLPKSIILPTHTDFKIPASVLLLLMERDHTFHLWFVRRAKHLRRHQGQIAFPGGKYEPSDLTYQETALRETYEEIGIQSTNIDILGTLQPVETSTGYLIFPFVGWLKQDLIPILDPLEIADAFSLPLLCFFQMSPCLFHGQGFMKFTPSYAIDSHVIWGATARILSDFIQIVRSLVCTP